MKYPSGFAIGVGVSQDRVGTSLRDESLAPWNTCDIGEAMLSFAGSLKGFVALEV
jgi:hypothetical protein